MPLAVSFRFAAVFPYSLPPPLPSSSILFLPPPSSPHSLTPPHPGSVTASALLAGRPGPCRARTRRGAGRVVGGDGLLRDCRCGGCSGRKLISAFFGPPRRPAAGVALVVQLAAIAALMPPLAAIAALHPPGHGGADSTAGGHCGAHSTAGVALQRRGEVATGGYYGGQLLRWAAIAAIAAVAGAGRGIWVKRMKLEPVGAARCVCMCTCAVDVPRVAWWFIRRVENPEVPGSRPARKRYPRRRF
jgi:hypothetical protein